MKLHEWKELPYERKMELRKQYGIKPSTDVVTISVGGVTRVEDDGIREGDISALENVTLEDVLKDESASEVTKEPDGVTDNFGAVDPVKPVAKKKKSKKNG